MSLPLKIISTVRGELLITTSKSNPYGDDDVTSILQGDGLTTASVKMELERHEKIHDMREDT